MDNKPLFDREMIWPIVLGGLSVIGIGVVFVIARLSDTREAIPAPDTETPFYFEYLGTEPGLSTLTPDVTDTPFATATDGSQDPIITLPPVTGIVSTSTTQPSRTPTPSPTIESILSKFDDTYSQLLYSGDWVSQSDVSGTYQNTLHISFEVGNSISFTFVGEQIIISYQAAPSLGRVTITLDGLQFEIDQATSSTQLVDWQSGILVRGTHTIVFTHLSGGSVNLDSITIPSFSTPTPTLTATP